MRVLLITGSFPPMRCGVGDYSQKLADALMVGGRLQVAVLTSDQVEGRNARSGIEIFPVMKKWRLTETHRVIRVIGFWKPDLIHIQYPTQGYGSGMLPWILPLVAYFMRVKVVQTWHEIYGIRYALRVFLKSITPSQLIVVRPHYKELLQTMMRWTLWGKEPKYIRNASVIPRAEMSAEQKSEFRKKYLQEQKRLIVFFGFVYPSKGVEFLFDIADPETDRIIIAGVVDKNEGYGKDIETRAQAPKWLGKVEITGFLESEEIARLLVVADAVILPFRVGGGEWNTSLHSAIHNGTFVITTSASRNGYDKSSNVYYARIDDLNEMRKALNIYFGSKREPALSQETAGWSEIADQHLRLYEKALQK